MTQHEIFTPRVEPERAFDPPARAIHPRKHLDDCPLRTAYCILAPFMDIGTEWLVEAAGCRAEALRDPALLDDLFARVIADLDLRPLHAPAWHVFPDPGGVTGFVMLSESHLACHTYPEHGMATINLYCCRPRPDWPWQDRLAEMLGATDVRVRVVDRSFIDQAIPEMCR